MNRVRQSMYLSAAFMNVSGKITAFRLDASFSGKNWCYDTMRMVLDHPAKDGMVHPVTPTSERGLLQ